MHSEWRIGCGCIHIPPGRWYRQVYFSPHTTIDIDIDIDTVALASFVCMQTKNLCLFLLCPISGFYLVNTVKFILSDHMWAINKWYLNTGDLCMKVNSKGPNQLVSIERWFLWSLRQVSLERCTCCETAGVAAPGV